MPRRYDLELLSEIDFLLFQIEFNLYDKRKVQLIMREIRKKMIRYKTTRPRKIVKPKKGLIAMLYSEDIEKLKENGFTKSQIALITGTNIDEIKKYFERKEKK